MNRLKNYMIMLTCTLLMCGTSLRADATPDYSVYKRLLKTYILGDKVHYKAWVENDEDVAALKAFVEQLGETDINSLTESDQVALYINLYNALMLRTVIDKYPIKSVRTIGLLPFSIFKKDLIRLAGREVSLDEIEKGILLKDYFDPRIHFAVNCASESCPPLRAEPFFGNRLDEQLEEQARLFAESARAAQVDAENRSVAYSELFKWYASDFDVDNPADYLNRYRSVPLPTNYTVNWIPYDWTLNDVKEEKGQ